LDHMEADTEIIAVLDGWDTELPDDPKLRVLRFKESVGQRRATNEAAMLSKAAYLMKVDAHCAFDQGFDRKCLELMQNDWTMVPVMRNLHAFDWVCDFGHRRYQGPSGPCKACGRPTRMDIKWIGKSNPQSTSYCFDTEPHFQYFGDYKSRHEAHGQITETMSLQGSCFLVTRDKYFELDLCGEEFGSWGSQGLEVACKTWLSGGRVVCNHNTWYAHMFRTQGGDFGFPYQQSGNKIQAAKKLAGNIFFDNKWDKQVRPLSWLIEKFKPIPGWHYEVKGKRNHIEYHPEITERVMKKGEEFNRTHAVIAAPKPKIGFVYYSDGNVNESLLSAVQRQIAACCNGHDLVSVTLKPMDFGRNIHMEAERGYLTMFRQILKGVEECNADMIYLVEHDVAYHPSHFDFIPPTKDTFYYDENKWMVDINNGHALFYNHMSVSMLCAYRELLMKHYRARVEKVEKEGFTRSFGFEPGSHRPPRGCDNYGRMAYWAKHPSLDIRHDRNLTSNRWRKKDFRNQKQLYAWTEKKVWELDGWNREQLNELLPTIKGE
jgi:hypothetical protein